MAAPTNALTTLTNIGNREDLEDEIYRVVPEETPFTNNIGRTKAKAVTHEWQTETLRTASATSSTALEGGDSTATAANLTTRLGNYCQINLDRGSVSGTAEVVDKAGRSSEITRQKVLKGLELKRDFELRALGNNFPAVAESGATTRKMAGILCFLTSNDSRGAGGSDGSASGGIFTTAATNGTQRTFTETLLKASLNSCFTSGGKPSQLYLGPTHKQQASAFTGIASLRKDVPGDKMGTIIGAADVYVSDFGNLTMIPHAYALTRDAVLVSPDMAAVATLRGWTTEPVAKTGDAENFQILAEKTLVVRNQAAHGVVADLT